jgi:hypothetical protein
MNVLIPEVAEAPLSLRQ